MVEGDSGNRIAGEEVGPEERGQISRSKLALERQLVSKLRRTT